MLSLLTRDEAYVEAATTGGVSTAGASGGEGTGGAVGASVAAALFFWKGKREAIQMARVEQRVRLPE